MKTIISFFKRTILYTILLISFTFSYSQPSSFTWQYRHTGWKNPISPAKNQGENGPCSIFAAVAGVEAMASLYYMLGGTQLILSESSIYNVGPEGGCTAITCGTGSIQVALDTIRSVGIVDNVYYPYSSTCRTDCQQVFSSQNYNYKINIPKSSGSQLTIDSALVLQQSIMDYGPIMVTLGGNYGGYYATHYLYPGTSHNFDHSVLIIGWRQNPELEWHIKDSWFEKPTIYYLSSSIDIFNFQPTFYRVHPLDEFNNPISCVGDGCPTAFSNRVPEDHDNDGFYNWGFEPFPPDDWTGIGFMDFDDGDPNTIFRNGYNILKGPYISDTISKYVCPGGRIFTLNNFDNLSNLGFSVNWTVSPSGYFSSSPSGNNDTATVTPIASYVGKQCRIEFNLSYNSILVKTYKFEFIINGPREDLVSMSVLDSYGGSPPNSGDMYYLCPNTTYNIYYNNYDNNCQTSNFVWDLPYGWTKHWDYGHILSINTNDYPYGLLDVKANHCCADSIPVKVYSLYFAEADCGEYFMAYPNPSSEFVDIDVVKDKISSEDLVSDIKTYLSIVDKSGTVRFSTTFKGFPYRVNTSDLPDGIYFLNIQFKDKRSSIRLVIKH